MNTNEQNTNQQAKKLNMDDQSAEIAIAQQAAALIKDEDDLSVVIKNRLADSRQLAVNHFLASQTEMQLASEGGILQWLNVHMTAYFLHHRAITAAFAMMLVTFFAVQQFGLNDNIENSDAYLLASDLPPEAFADKGFNTWIASAHN